MKLETLKNSILNKTVGNSFLVFVCPDNTFVANQYIEGIVKARGIQEHKLNSLSELNSADAFIFDYASMLNILRVEVFDEFSDNYGAFENVIVICEKVDKKIKSFVADYIVEFPKLTDWQIKDYIRAVCPALDEEDATKLYLKTKGDIYKIDSELSKLTLFKQKEQKDVFMHILFDDNSDVYSIDNFAISGAIIKNDKAKIKDLLMHKDTFEVDPFGIIALVLSDYKKMLFVNQDSGIKSFESIGITDKQAYAIRQVYKDIPIQRIMKAIKFLSGLDLKIRSGELDMPKESLLEYVICNLMY